MYEVYALKYGERDTTACQFFYREASHESITLHYYVWLILGGPHPILVDTGFLDDDARERGIRSYVSPAAMVERAGVKPGDVPVALITHLHYDHWAGHSLFPGAEYWIQRDEVAFWTGPYGHYPAFRQSANVGALARLVTLNYASRVRIIDGDRQVLPGIGVHRVGGHTAGLQIVTVQTRRGTVVLTSDASHFYRNVETRQPVQIITSLPEMLAAFETIHALAGAERRLPRPVLAAPRRKPTLSLEVGRGRRAGVGQPHEARDGAAGDPPDPHRRGDRHRPRALGLDAVLRHPALRRAHQAHLHEPALESPRQQRGGPHQRDRPGGHPTRRLRPSDDRGQGLQLLQGGRHRDPWRLHEGRHREGRLAHHARRADRRRRPEGRRHPARHLRDHGAGSAAGAPAAEPETPSRRRRDHPHRLGQAVGEGQRALRQELPRHRRRRRRMAGEAGSDAGRIGQLAGGGRAEPRSRGVPPRPPNHARGERHSPAGELEAR